MFRRLALSCALCLVVAACSDDAASTTAAPTTTAEATTTTAAAVTTTTAAVGTTEPSGGMVDTFDGSTFMVFPLFADNVVTDFVDGGVMRVTRQGLEGSGFSILGLYAAQFDEMRVTARLRTVSTGSGVRLGLIVLTDSTFSTFVEVELDDVGAITVYPALEGYPTDMVGFPSPASFRPGEFNDLAVQVEAGTLTVYLNDVPVGNLTGLPPAIGFVGIVFVTQNPGDAIEIDEFRIEPPA